MGDKIFTCLGCNQSIVGHPNNGRPLYDGGVCDSCNTKVVVARLEAAEPKKVHVDSIKTSFDRIEVAANGVASDIDAAIILINDGNTEEATRNLRNAVSLIGSLIEEIENTEIQCRAAAGQIQNAETAMDFDEIIF